MIEKISSFLWFTAQRFSSYLLIIIRNASLRKENIKWKEE